MTTATAVGAISSEAAEWYAIDWPTIERNVRRLQVRIVQATKESRWGKVKSLQRLLTHSNCALDGLELLLKEDYPTGRRLKSLGGLCPAVNFIRYADDFVITSRLKDLLEGEVQPLVEKFLQQRGLKPLPRRPSLRTWRKALISSDKTCAATLTGNCSLSLPRRMSKPSWMASELRLKLGLACPLPIWSINSTQRFGVGPTTIGTWSANVPLHTLIILSSISCGGGHGEGTRKSPRPGSKRNTMGVIGGVTGVSSGNDMMTRGSLARLGCTTPAAHPSNDT